MSLNRTHAKDQGQRSLDLRDRGETNRRLANRQMEPIALPSVLTRSVTSCHSNASIMVASPSAVPCRITFSISTSGHAGTMNMSQYVPQNSPSREGTGLGPPELIIPQTASRSAQPFLQVSPMCPSNNDACNYSGHWLLAG